MANRSQRITLVVEDALLSFVRAMQNIRICSAIGVTIRRRSPIVNEDVQPKGRSLYLEMVGEEAIHWLL